MPSQSNVVYESRFRASSSTGDVMRHILYLNRDISYFLRSSKKLDKNEADKLLLENKVINLWSLYLSNVQRTAGGITLEEGDKASMKLNELFDKADEVFWSLVEELELDEASVASSMYGCLMMSGFG